MRTLLSLDTYKPDVLHIGATANAAVYAQPRKRSGAKPGRKEGGLDMFYPDAIPRNNPLTNYNVVASSSKIFTRGFESHLGCTWAASPKNPSRVPPICRNLPRSIVTWP